MNCPIAIVGVACRYPDAQTPAELFENAAAQRRSFRKLPDGRLNAQYFDESGRSPDRAYARQAAVIGGFAFDRDRFLVSRNSYDATDLTHWLALTVAREAVEDIQFRRAAAHVGNEAVRVIVGNTLTGEFSRAGTMRIRWPYVRGVVADQLRNSYPDLDPASREGFLRALEGRYKSAFVVPNEDSLAGGLSNTIAGRICNHFDFKGGGYSIDGACCSSLLAVSDACSALATRDVDLVLAGGVDLSLDPFELVGFSRTAALARNEMLIYDEDSQGFWPGEGCGFVALMRYADALERCERIHAVIRGWGVSSDGRGGLTRPDAEGQRLALRRCYQRAEYGIETVAYFEGHGTGTRVGDAAELRALIDARHASGQRIHPAVISSVKANIGHTKAAAGLAGLIRATLCLENKVVPPTTACRRPHRHFSGEEDNLVPSDRARVWEPAAVPRRAGISAMGFGGINTHIAIEEAPTVPSVTVAVPAPTDPARFAGVQDCELFLFAAVRRADLAWTINHVASFAGQLSRAELTDLAMELAGRATRGGWTPCKAAVVASTPAELRHALGRLAEELDSAVESETGFHVLSFSEGIFLSSNDFRGRLGFIFSGQAAPLRADGAAWARRFEAVRALYEHAALGSYVDRSGTAFAQPAIVTASLAGLEILESLGVSADLAIGHSLGELTALHWAGCFDVSDLLTIARGRGRAMADDTFTSGAMAAVEADHDETLSALAGHPTVSIAGFNSPRQTVVAGRREDIENFVDHVSSIGFGANLLPVAQAFHTPAMATVAQTLKSAWQAIGFRPPAKRIISTVTGQFLTSDVEVASHLCRQIVSPVDFLGAVRTATREVDLFVEVGPGERFAHLARATAGKPVVSVDAAAASLASLLAVAGAAHVLNRAPRIGNLFQGRFSRRFTWDWRQTFFTNPCESVPTEAEAGAEVPVIEPPLAAASPVAGAPSANGESIRDRLCSILAQRTGLPVWRMEGSSRMMSDFHLNSITVGEVAAQLATSIGLPPLVDPTEYADASIDRIAAGFEQMREAGGALQLREGGIPSGLGTWVCLFGVGRAEAARPPPAPDLPMGTWEGFGSMGSEEHALLERLNRQAHGHGVIVWVGASDGRQDLKPLLLAAHRAIERAHELRHSITFAVIQQRPGFAGFARSFFLENLAVSTVVVNVSQRTDSDLAPAILREVDADRPPFLEVFLDAASGRREEPRLSVIRTNPAAQSAIGDADVVLVTGGGRGIAAECAFRLSRQTGCSLLILGRSSAADTADLAANLARMAGAGLRVAYRQADVTDGMAVAAAVASGVEELGAEVTGLIHGAGLNLPRTVVNLTPVRMEATIAPKVDGLRHALAALNPERLKLLATFSSIIGRIGLPGEADYALANEWLSLQTEDFQALHPGCRCRAIEWSVWSGVGMGQRLGRVDILARQGIVPISIDEGVCEFLRVIDAPDLPVRVVVSGRYGKLGTISADTLPSHPFRFLESIPVFYPGIELIADCKVSPETDPYLEDHQLNGERLFPAVMSLEAMAQAAVALATRQDRLQGGPRGGPALRFRNVRFRKAIAVPGDPGHDFSIRIIALAEPNGAISLALRCSGTAFQVNHVEARCSVEWCPRRGTAEPEMDAGSSDDLLPVNPDGALYRNALFQKGRFQRVAGYRLIEARRCSGRLSAGESTRWFSPGLPQGFLLGDPGARDAALHAVQACIPHKVVIPVFAGEVDCGCLDSSASYQVAATEVEDRGNELVYDLTVACPNGSIREQWKGITLRLLSDVPDLRLNSLSLMAPFLERKIAAILPQAELSVRIEQGTQSRWQSTRPSPLHYRPDGKPDPSGARCFSASWHENWRLSVESVLPVGCDLQGISGRAASNLLELLGPEGIALASAVSEMTSDPLDFAAVRVWSIREALKKSGLAFGAPLTVAPDSSKQWAVFHSGASVGFSSLVQPDDGGDPVCVALVVGPAALLPNSWKAEPVEPHQDSEPPRVRTTTTPVEEVPVMKDGGKVEQDHESLADPV